ncbi:MAG TPA: ECF transporter S component [Acholeplasma sp.]|nr:ECF transporter S component [Acholeplasma sp.]
MKKIIRYAVIFGLIPLILVLFYFLLDSKQYGIISVLIAILALIPFYLSFEGSKPKIEELILVAIVIAINIVSRILFAPLPGIKPIGAIIIIAALIFGKEAGFMIGSLTMAISNFYFGQGPWTPFQMFGFGIIGYLAGLFKNNFLKKNIYFVLFLGGLSGIFYVLLIDVWTTLQVTSGFNFKDYFNFIIISTPTTIGYMASNMLFLILLYKPLMNLFERIQKKFNLFNDKTSK